MSGPVRTRALRSLRPGRARVAGAVIAAGLTVALGWLVGATTGRTVVALVAAAVLVLVLRTADPVETRWPPPPARRHRPGWHVVASAQRAMEAARDDPDDRRSFERRLDRVRTGGPDPRLDVARTAVGLPAPRPRGHR